MRIKLNLLIAPVVSFLLIGCNGASSPQVAAAPVSQSASPAKPVARSTAPATMPAVVILQFNPESMDAIEAGTKTSTTRKGARQFPGNVAIARNGERKINLVILSAVPKKLGELTETDARSDGSGSLESFKARLSSDYKGLSPSDTLTVITFRVSE